MVVVEGGDVEVPGTVPAGGEVETGGEASGVGSGVDELDVEESDVPGVEEKGVPPLVLLPPSPNDEPDVEVLEVPADVRSDELPEPVGVVVEASSRLPVICGNWSKVPSEKLREGRRLLSPDVVAVGIPTELASIVTLSRETVV